MRSIVLVVDDQFQKFWSDLRPEQERLHGALQIENDVSLNSVQEESMLPKIGNDLGASLDGQEVRVPICEEAVFFVY